MNRKLSEKWIKASIAGTIWAASEIVLGSFLHNLKVPFSGNVLTAIGIIILISISYIWKEKGLFWRAGLVCAIMKTMSPSAVIFGPMIAIFAEGVLLEISSLLLGRTIIGYCTGAMLAMSWNLFHKIISYIIYYGSNIIDVYANLLKMAQKQLNIETDIVWMPIIILLIVYALFGLFAAFIGISVGRKMLRQPPETKKILKNEIQADLKRNTGQFNYSVIWLFLNIALIISSFILLNATKWFVWAPAILIMTLIWSLRYRRALRQLLKPKFWVIFILITLVTAFVFSAAGEGDFWRNGLLTGISMNFRAVVIIMGFSALGTELYNPVVRNFFSSTAFRNLPLAVELSVESLPDFVAAIPDFKSFTKNPISVFYQVISHAETRFNEIRGRQRSVFLVTGDKAQGKTTFTKKVVELLKKNDVPVSGFLAERVMDNEETTGYNLVNAESGESEPFLRASSEEGRKKIGKFIIIPEGLAFGKKILHKKLKGKTIIVVDEVGALELRDEGWAENINMLLEKSDNHLILVVRNDFVINVNEKWNFNNPIQFNITGYTPEQAGEIILNRIRQNQVSI
ncbi:MAG TPA: nucleoside-triphosphatase [Bacteroidales bacterium]|nr:nucleoside-triphosphatase [Bacteroidales bacterium]